MKKGFVFLGMVSELFVLLLGAAYFGQVLDHHFGWPGYGMLVLIVVVLISWMYHLVVLLKRLTNDDGSDDSSKNDKSN